ncbi:Concanavalin A-like lectin/glucanase, subgroup [Artemisia annua]|uniref:Concanavalin A-like lectin/glucanase, subgroup n=1 Tax=Artemisia annua TaxID=35608 RepID=A0A2U1KGG2_ARTAN|nr:Concanavalin A-like lectin/glucanase, subgroup [Artemisia annua]
MASSMEGFEHLEIQLEEIKLATNNFNEENVIGHGGFGKVYKGELSHSHTEGKSMVALKRLDRKHGQGDAEFHKEVRMLSRYRHENIISLLGFSHGRDEMILVYDKGQLKVIHVPMWKESYEEKKLDRIILEDIKQQMNLRSLETFSGIAYQCLKRLRKERPTMSLVVEKLEIALQMQVLPKEYIEIANAAVDPLLCRSLEEFKKLLSKGVLLNGGKTWLSVNEKGEHIERIYIEACNPQLTYFSINQEELLRHPTGDIVNSRFPGGRCYYYDDAFKARVRGEYLTPHISYTLNLIFRYRYESNVNEYNPLRYEVDRESKVFIIYPSYMREDGWFIAPLYHFTTQHTTADLQFHFEYRQFTLVVAGIEFQPSEEKVELPVFEEYQHIVDGVSQSLFYTSLQELKQILSKGIHLKDYKTWFSLNEKGQHCHMISMEDCLIPSEDSTPQYVSNRYSRFPAGLYQTNYEEFTTHVKTQFLSPSIIYTVNLVCDFSVYHEQGYGKLKYKLRGETTTSTVNLANLRKVDDWLCRVELFQFTSDGSIVELEITFDYHGFNLEVEGILFQPLEKVEDNTEKRTMKKYIYSSIGKWFRFNN